MFLLWSFSVWCFDEACQTPQVTKHRAVLVRVGLIKAQNFFVASIYRVSYLYSLSLQFYLFLSSINRLSYLMHDPTITYF